MNVTDGRGRAASAPGLAAWLRRVAPPGAAGEVTIALVSDARMRSLNLQFGRKDAVTDVLSFPSAASRASRLARRELGDIAIATGVARRQAADAGHSYATELKVLALHGLLHLIGYDHHRPVDRVRMGRLERRLRAKGGLYEGLIERAARAGIVSHRPERSRERAKRDDPRERHAEVRSERAKRTEPRGRGEPAKRRARARVGESEGRSPSEKK